MEEAAVCEGESRCDEPQRTTKVPKSSKISTIFPIQQALTRAEIEIYS